MYTIERANTFIQENRDKINKVYRHTYHVMAPIGWINDPNGFIFYKGEYHIFYQYYPYKAVWGPMHWGHAKSKDLIHWEDVPVALAPDQPYDKDGCFSGTAIEKDGKLYLMYTGHIVDELSKKVKQVQCIAVSDDGGICFKKVKQNPVISEKDLPEMAMIEDFRDPKVLKRGSSYYSLIASRAKDGGGQILLYKSKDLLEWEFVSIMLKGSIKEGSMWECPDIFELDGVDVLIISIEGLPKEGNNYPNTHSCLVFTGKMDWESGIFHRETVEELDYGMDFYAPQTTFDDSNRRIMISWMQMWGRNIPTETEGHQWAGAMSLPRELVLRNNRIYQKPVSEIYDKLINHQRMKDILLVDEKRQLSDLSLEIGTLKVEVDTKKGKLFELEVRANELEKTVLRYDCLKETLELDRTQSGFPLIGKEIEQVYKRTISLPLHQDKLTLEIFLDRASVEVFINDGEYTMTSTIYPTRKASQINIGVEGEMLIKQIEKWDMKGREN